MLAVASMLPTMLAVASMLPTMLAVASMLPTMLAVASMLPTILLDTPLSIKEVQFVGKYQATAQSALD